LPEIIDHGVNGLVVEDTPEALAEAICHLANDRALVRSMSEDAFKKARAKFNLHIQARRIVQIYNQLSAMGSIDSSRRGRTNS
jgi:glycosyltransferase involved in cell wall biosynthesis